MCIRDSHNAEPFADGHQPEPAVVAPPVAVPHRALARIQLLAGLLQARVRKLAVRACRYGPGSQDPVEAVEDKGRVHFAAVAAKLELDYARVPKRIETSYTETPAHEFVECFHHLAFVRVIATPALLVIQDADALFGHYRANLLLARSLDGGPLTQMAADASIPTRSARPLEPLDSGPAQGRALVRCRCLLYTSRCV